MVSGRVFFSFRLSRPVKAGKCIIFDPCGTKTSAFCSISRGEAEKHSFGAPFSGTLFPGLFRGAVWGILFSLPATFFLRFRPPSRPFWGGFRLRCFLVFSLQAGLFRGVSGYVFFSFRPPIRGVFFPFPATFFSFRLRGPSRPETKTKKNAPQRFQNPLSQ